MGPDPIGQERLGHRLTQEEGHMETQGEYGHVERH